MKIKINDLEKHYVGFTISLPTLVEVIVFPIRDGEIKAEIFGDCFLPLMNCKTHYNIINKTNYDFEEFLDIVYNNVVEAVIEMKKPKFSNPDMQVAFDQLMAVLQDYEEQTQRMLEVISEIKSIIK